MDILTRFTGERCGIDNCRSRRYHRADDGLIYCQNGHQSSATFEVQLDDEFVGASQRTTRAQRSSPDASQASTLEPREACEAYLQCFQFVLQSQTKWVLAQTSLPTELETVVRDLWVVQAQLIEPLVLHATGEAGSRVFDSQRENDLTPGEEAARPTFSSAMSLIDCCAILYLGCVLLQLPVTVSNVLTWMESETFPFLITAPLLPVSIFARLPLSYRRTFHTRTGLPAAGEMHRATIQMAMAHARSTFLLQYPACNHRLVLMQFVAGLSLPLDIYPATVNLTSYLGYSFCFPPPEKGYVFLADHPELQLLCALVTTIKLVHPFDGILRLPQKDSEPAALQVDWWKWSKARDNARRTSRQRNQALWNTQEQDVFEMDDDEMDEYLDWFQRNWVNENVEGRSGRADFQKELHKLFPLPSVVKPSEDLFEQEDTRSVSSQNLKMAQETLRYLKPLAPHAHYGATEYVRPGSQWTYYRKPSDLPSSARPFFEAAARMGAISVEQLLIGVFQTEMRLRRGREATKAENDI